MKAEKVHQDSNNLFSSLEELYDKEYKSREQGGRLAREFSTDDFSCSLTEDDVRGSPQMARDNIIEKLKGDLRALSRQSETSDLELHALHKQVVMENRRGNEIRKLALKVIMHIFLSFEGDRVTEDLEKEYAILNLGLRAMAINIPRFSNHQALKILYQLQADEEKSKTIQSSNSIWSVKSPSCLQGFLSYA